MRIRIDYDLTIQGTVYSPNLVKPHPDYEICDYHVTIFDEPVTLTVQLFPHTNPNFNLRAVSGYRDLSGSWDVKPGHIGALRPLNEMPEAISDVIDFFDKSIITGENMIDEQMELIKNA